MPKTGAQKGVVFTGKNFTCRVKVVDAMMGTGKTSAAINYINENLEQKRFLYITPYLDEVDRVKKSCPGAKFYSPKPFKNTRGGKFIDLKKLLRKGENICTTHALFQLFDRECIDLCLYHDYVLIMDEVAEVVSGYEIGEKDLAGLLKLYAYVEPGTGILRWRDDQADYRDSYYQNEKRLIDLESLCVYGSDVTLWLFPVEAFNAFSEIYILTYMFDGQVQRYYYDYYGLPYERLYVQGDSPDTYAFSEVPGLEKKYDYRSLIEIVENDRMNKIGDPEFALSKNWYVRNLENPQMKELKKNLYNYFNNIRRSPTSDNLWTTFKDAKSKLSGNGYTRGFLACNARATNEYSGRHNIAYLVNRYINTVVKQFFVTHGVEVLEDEFALSEMVQFIWRSAIRRGEPISVYVPSSRMRRLLEEWLKKVST